MLRFLELKTANKSYKEHYDKLQAKFREIFNFSDLNKHTSNIVKDIVEAACFLDDHNFSKLLLKVESIKSKLIANHLNEVEKSVLDSEDPEMSRQILFFSLQEGTDLLSGDEKVSEQT